MYFDPVFLRQRGLITTGFHLPYNPKLIERANKLRKNQTLAEKKLWQLYLRNLKYRVLRQRVIDHFIVDFYCPKLKLVIEIDGDIHDQEEIKIYDEQRTLFLEVYYLEIIRFKNREIMENFPGVIRVINRYLKDFT